MSAECGYEYENCAIMRISKACNTMAVTLSERDAKYIEQLHSGSIECSVSVRSVIPSKKFSVYVPSYDIQYVTYPSW